MPRLALFRRCHRARPRPPWQLLMAAEAAVGWEEAWEVEAWVEAEAWEEEAWVEEPWVEVWAEAWAEEWEGWERGWE